MDPSHGVTLLAFDQLGELPFAPPQTLVQLVERAPAFVRVRVELGRAGLDGFLGRSGELVPEPHEPGALLLALGFETLGVGGDPRFGLGNELLLAVSELRELITDRALRSFEIVRPCS
jgi:hypothetical protein